MKVKKTLPCELLLCLPQANPYQPACGAALTVWPYKLLLGFPGDDRTVPLSSVPLSSGGAPDSSAATAATPPGVHGGPLCTEPYCLFNVEVDPSETVDLVAAAAPNRSK